MSLEIAKALADVSTASESGVIPKFEVKGDFEGTTAESDVVGDENIPEFDKEEGDSSKDDVVSGDEIDEAEQLGLSEEEKTKVREETGWSDEIIDHIDSMDQYEILKKADLVEREVNGRPCLVKKDLDLDVYRDPKTGLTNRERMSRQPPPPGAGPLSPIDSKSGEKIELHHLGQDKNGPFVELTVSEHRGPGNHAIMHPRHEDSWRNGENNFEQEKSEHWQERVKGA